MHVQCTGVYRHVQAFEKMSKLCSYRSVHMYGLMYGQNGKKKNMEQKMPVLARKITAICTGMSRVLFYVIAEII